MIDRFFDRVTRAIELALAISFVFAVLLNFTNVVARYIFGRTILWADEVQIFIMVAMTFIGAVVVTWRRQHLRMDVLASQLPPVLRAVLQIAELVLMLVICTFIVVQSLDYTSRMFDIGRTSDTAGVPMWIPHGTLATGFLLMVIICFWQLASGFRSGFAKRGPMPGEQKNEDAN